MMEMELVRAPVLPIVWTYNPMTCRFQFGDVTIDEVDMPWELVAE